MRGAARAAGRGVSAAPADAPVRLFLKRREERRIRAGHPWVFSNEIDVARSPLKTLPPGEPVEIRTAADRFLANAYANPRSLICARVVGRRPAERLDAAAVRERIAAALRLRERLFPDRCYRLVYGESDALPGLVVDRYDAVLVVQVTTAGMARLLEPVLEALRELVEPRGILLRNDNASRALEGLRDEVAVASGEVPDRVEVRENGARYLVEPAAGQKTGWYFDQRDNRARLSRYAAGARVLDAFSYTGAWGVQAALAGAREVLCVDGSQGALALAEENARCNGVEGVLRTRHGDVFDVLRDLRARGESLDLVVVDPPAFVRRRRDLQAGLEAYGRLNRLAMQVLAPDGFLFTASCSFHLGRDQLRGAVREAGNRAGRRVQILEEGHQAPDHPVHPAMPESDYLKLLVCRVG